MTRLLAATALAFFIAQGTALANDAKSADATTSATPSETQTAANLPQQIKSDLKDDGYTDVKVVPGSYVVNAKDKHGNTVTMFIGPHSMTMVKAITGDQTTGSTSNPDDQENSATKK